MTDVAAVDGDLAHPFVASACRRYELTFDAESGDGMLWWAGFERGSIRAMMGWAPVDASTLAVFGPFGDGSVREDTWINDLLLAMCGTPFTLIVVPASPSLYVRRQSVQLERYGTVRTPQHFARTA